MFIPIRTDRPLRRTPRVNYAIIGANVLVYIAQLHAISDVHNRQQMEQVWFNQFILNPVDPQWYQFLSYQFLHSTGDWLHLVFNMLFLYVFGNNVEDRFGPVGYLVFYLAGGVLAGVGHCALESSPVLGASGAVAGVTGAFLALFPYTRLTVLVFFFIITFFEIPSFYLILAFVGLDLLRELMGGGHVAYLAHLTGYGFGFLLGMGLLATRILKREPYDLLALLGHWNRRRRFKAVAREGGMWTADASRQMPAEPVDENEQQLMQQRHEVAEALQKHDKNGALDAYERLVHSDPDQVLHRQAQLDIGNYAMDAGRHGTAAHAYERFAEKYPRDSYTPEVHLILGLIYLRYLNQPDLARPHLADAVEKIENPQRRRMAQQMLNEIGDVAGS